MISLNKMEEKKFEETAEPEILGFTDVFPQCVQSDPPIRVESPKI